MQLTELNALSPLDGRYASKTQALRPYFSEYGLIFYRCMVEIRWLQALANEPNIKEVTPLNDNENEFLENILAHFDEVSALRVKTIERTTNHDVKAVEYFLKEKLAEHPSLKTRSEFIHFACTSEDINNIAYGLMIAEAVKQQMLPMMRRINLSLSDFAKSHAKQPMLSRTHGQSATPTTLGKEFANVYTRLHRQFSQLQQIEIFAKLNGAVGNFNAHMIAYPDVNWLNLSRNFITELGLSWQAYTTQIEPHDYLAEISAIMNRYNTILIDLCQDIWGYISIGYFKQRTVENEVGSSTMPHKVNPIDFENAEGNLGLANALFHFFATKLPISRWQRDLSDSTVLRNIGCGFGYSYLAYQSLSKGLSKLEVNKAKLETDLNANWEVLGEAVQTVMRRYGIENPYEKLKAFTRGKQIDATQYSEFVRSQPLPDEIKVQLLALSPQTYIGLAELLAELPQL